MENLTKKQKIQRSEFAIINTQENVRKILAYTAVLNEKKFLKNKLEEIKKIISDNEEDLVEKLSFAEIKKQEYKIFVEDEEKNFIVKIEDNKAEIFELLKKY